MRVSYNVEKVKNIKGYKIPLHIYPVEVIVFFSKENSELEEVWSKVKPEADAMVQNFLQENSTILLRFRNKKTPVSVLAHESVHIAEYVLHHIGHRFDADEKADEPLAYLVEYITSEVLNLAKKQGVKFDLA